MKHLLSQSSNSSLIAGKTLLDKFDSRAVNFALKDHNDLKSRSRVIFMRPEIFLSLADPLTYRDNFKLNRIEGLLDSDTKIADLPLLVTVSVTHLVFRVVGHEGRHRSVVFARRYPDKLMPVVIRDRDTRWLEDGYVDGAKITLVSENSKIRKVITL